MQKRYWKVWHKGNGGHMKKYSHIFTPVNNSNLYKWYFLVTERKNKNSPLKKYSVIAENYQEARKIIATKFIYAYAGKVPAY